MDSALLIAATLNSGTVLALAGLGLLINERAGVLNLGAEGTLLMAALAGFVTTLHTGSTTLGLLAGAGAGVGMALLLGVLIIYLQANSYATGLALSLLGGGLSAFLGVDYVQAKLPAATVWFWPGLSDIPWIGPALLRQHPMVYLTMALTAFLAYGLQRQRWGLVLRAVGESPASAHALGYPVRAIRLGATLAGGALCGLAGAYLSLVYTPLWVEGMVAGKGWIALALTTFATWRPVRVLVGAWLFGGVTMLQFYWQGQGLNLSPALLSMLPYLVTIVVLVLISSDAQWIRRNMPASLGQPFRPGH
ncbi:ABC transporter permease [Amphibiibacter pelophylacis]|uniref:ABC transporter permease n=1 Tax=Amphibiibacter pelophylacis TaxID=1799477 RepID=A0ACC6P2P0_9BURK